MTVVDPRGVAEQDAVRGSMGFFPLAGFDLITHDAADQALGMWGRLPQPELVLQQRLRASPLLSAGAREAERRHVDQEPSAGA